MVFIHPFIGIGKGILTAYGDVAGKGGSFGLASRSRHCLQTEIYIILLSPLVSGGFEYGDDHNEQTAVIIRRLLYIVNPLAYRAVAVNKNHTQPCLLLA